MTDEAKGPHVRGRWDAVRAAPGVLAVLGDARFGAAVASSALAVALLVGRYATTGEWVFLWMVWNLFLAWLLFLPNAPYMVTDLLHLRPRAGVPLWYDALLLFTFAWAGCVLGFASLSVVHRRVEAWLGRAAGWAVVGGVGLLSGFGIYLGRFLRWNSWDVLTRPGALAEDVLVRVLRPADHPRTWAITLLFALFMWCAYAVFRTPVTVVERPGR